ncbi:MAG: hypothetical protein ACFFHD_02455 [Promethearchaeota archaeon]
MAIAVGIIPRVAAAINVPVAYATRQETNDFCMFLFKLIKLRAKMMDPRLPKKLNIIIHIRIIYHFSSNFKIY